MPYIAGFEKIICENLVKYQNSFPTLIIMLILNFTFLIHYIWILLSEKYN